MSNWTGHFLVFSYRLLFPLLLVLVRVASLFHSKLAAGFKMRKNSPWLHTPSGSRPIWFHCASGEFEYAKPVILRLKKRWPEIPILVTYFSPSSQKNIQSFAEVDIATPTPFDLPSSWKSFIQHHQPRCLLIARTDIWPEMLRQCCKNGVPSLLFSATLADQSGRMGLFARPFYSELYKNLRSIFCVSADDIENFKKLGVKNNIKESGDTRFDQVLERLRNPRPLKEELFKTCLWENTFVAGSTWSEDEQHILKAFSQTHKRHSELKMILAPHEPNREHLEKLEKDLKAEGLRHTYYSSANSWVQEDVLIIDQVGILAELYSYGGLAFVGGSFRKTVHSVMEPLAAGACTLVGPLHANNREALEFKKISLLADWCGVMTVFNEKSLCNTIEQWQTFSSKKEFQSSLVREVQKRTGGSIAIEEWVANNAQEIDETL